jgi:hypothetical protein
MRDNKKNTVLKSCLSCNLFEYKCKERQLVSTKPTCFKINKGMADKYYTNGNRSLLFLLDIIHRILLSY